VKRLLLLLVSLALVTSACGDAIRPSAAKVNGTTITKDELDEELQAIEGNSIYVQSVQQGGFDVLGKGQGTLTEDFVGRVLTRQIFLSLVHQEVQRRKLTISDADIDRSQDEVVQSVGGNQVFTKFPKAYQRTLLRRNAEVVKLQQALGGPAVTDEAIKAYYDANPDQFAQTCVSHILFAVTGSNGQLDQAATAAQSDQLLAQATAARAEIVGGADFAAVAAQKSADTSNKDQGGNLECGAAGRFVPEFEQAMDALPINEVSQPVKTQFGYHLIKVTSRDPQPLADATPAIRQQLESEGQAGFSDFLQKALSKAKISVNPRYGTFSKDGQSPGVIPPKAPTTTVAGSSSPSTPALPPLRPGAAGSSSSVSDRRAPTW
jgi:parvulin-like peptidyl-prolyl isomerase